MDDQIILDKAKALLDQPVPLLDGEVLRGYVKGFFDRRDLFLRAVKEFGSPLYVLDEAAIVRKAREFKSAFARALPRSKCFYALKSNYHPFLLGTLVGQGYHLDVSSGWELEQALAQGASEIIFSGPAKTKQELALACRHAGKVTVLMDSFAERARLEEAAAREGVTIKAGVRLMIEEDGLWRKFGIPLRRLAEFFAGAEAYSHVDLRGLQFHASWNLDPSRQISFIEKLGEILAGMPTEQARAIDFIDIGGGYWPAQGEWAHPGATPDGKFRQCLEPRIAEGMDHRCFSATPLADFAGQIRESLQKNIFPHADPEIYLEPGRWISNGSMHIVLQVLDKKAGDVVVTDGATSAVGWERYETDYCPVLNLSRPSLDERACMVFGALCTPHDLWGYSYFGEEIEEEDVLLIPDQGAYTYSLRQHFIKPLPRQVILSGAKVKLFQE